MSRTDAFGWVKTQSDRDTWEETWHKLWPSLPPSGKPLKLPLRSGVLLGLDLAEDFVGDIVLEASAYAVDLDGTERATRGNSRWKKKALKIQACSLTHEINTYVQPADIGWPYWNWKETKLQPGTAGPGNILGCCLLSFHLLWAILCLQAVYGQRLGFVTFDSVVPLSDRFCLGSWKLGRNCRIVGQNFGTSKIKSTKSNL